MPSDRDRDERESSQRHYDRGVGSSNLRLPAIVSSALVLPLMILELVNRRGFLEDFPIVLFGLVWLLSLLFILILMPIVRGVRAGHGITVNPMGLLLRAAFLIPIAWLLVVIILDQMPCFLGVANCD
jgi:cation transport ATPase